MSTQPGDPSPHQPAPPRKDGTTDDPPPGFFRQTAALFANRNAKILLAIIAVLLIVLGIVMVGSVESSSKGPGPGGVVDVPSLVAPLLSLH
ncbi:hypothetical protein [Patulibacter sp.]|uniref:hypothetical protein n=1 Tax=Patulibacter sp. TaxID=1912859 RepID=UPI002727D4AF|nr:hypothetical protein [Patulibacter sp.]MDO9409376.1 hypothetical protein [Patulibacter sp.]